MGYMTAEQVRDWAAHQPEDAFFCEDCLTKLVENEDGELCCPNELCRNEERWKVNPDSEAASEALVYVGQIGD